MEEFFAKYHKALYNCTKPYQYVGGEFLSANKDFCSAKVRVALCFPDKYEIGISNLGARILYNHINKQERYMADRAYAPEPDFKPEILYGVESKRPLNEFDVVGFSIVDNGEESSTSLLFTSLIISLSLSFVIIIF